MTASNVITAPARAAPRPLSQDQLRQILEMQAELLSADFNLDSFMQDIAERIQAFTFATGAVVELVDGEEMVYRAATGSAAGYLGFCLKRNGSLSGLCVQAGEVMLSQDTSKDPRVDAAACKKVGAASMVVVPLKRKGVTAGVLKVLSDQTHAFGDHDVYTLNLMAGVLGGALGQQIEMHSEQQLREELRHKAQNDPLTGLPNRALFNDRLAQAIARDARSDRQFALMYMDIDRFKLVNDTYGHSMGDAVLEEFARRVRSVVRSSDTLARLGGDEFALIAENLRNREEAEQIAQKILLAVRSPCVIGGQTFEISTSIGIAVAQKGMDAEQLVRKADEAIYEVKKAGRNNFRFSEN